MVYQYELQLEIVVPSEISEWTDEGIDELRVSLLEKMLASVDDKRVNLKTRTENVEWILDDSIHPFSFLVCCEAAGVNPYKLREKLIDNINRWIRLRYKK